MQDHEIEHVLTVLSGIDTCLTLHKDKMDPTKKYCGHAARIQGEDIVLGRSTRYLCKCCYTALHETVIPLDSTTGCDGNGL